MTREITREELVEALRAIGIELERNTIYGVAQDGRHVRLNGETNNGYHVLVVEVADKG